MPNPLFIKQAEHLRGAKKIVDPTAN